jgi:hypothetical protein
LPAIGMRLWSNLRTPNRFAGESLSRTLAGD